MAFRKHWPQMSRQIGLMTSPNENTGMTSHPPIWASCVNKVPHLQTINPCLGLCIDRSKWVSLDVFKDGELFLNSVHKYK